MGAPVVHWEINSNNAEALQEFYSKLFGWNVDANNPMHYGLVNTGTKVGIGGGIGQNDPSQPSPTPVTFYAAVKDMQGTLSKAVSLGATIVMPVTEIPNMVTMAMFRDLDGNIIGIVKDEPPPKPKKATKKSAKKPVKKAAKKVVKKSQKRAVRRGR
jgi:uncharacterized protein